MKTNSTSISIPWDKFKEEEIHSLLALLYSSLGYSVDHLHKSDRANEEGADIVVKKGRDIIAFAVKIKPSHVDRYQLLELSRRTEPRKVYVYIQTPTKKFHDSMKTDGKGVEFWDTNKLNEIFVSENLFLTAHIIFENHNLHKNLKKIQEHLINLWLMSKKKKKRRVKRITRDSFFTLWRLKDIAVTLHKTNELALEVFENPVNFKNRKLDEHFLWMFLGYLDRLEEKSSVFLLHFLQFFKNNKNLVYNSIIKQSDRSHWITLARYKPLNNLIDIDKVLEKSINMEKAFRKLQESTAKTTPEISKTLKEQITSNKSNIVWKAIEVEARILFLFGYALEEIIDDIIKEYFKDYDTLDYMEPLEG